MPFANHHLGLALLIAMIGGCAASEEKAAEPAAADTGPKYASPWDKPIGGERRVSASKSTAPAPRSATLTEMLNQSGIAATSGAVISSPSPWEPGTQRAAGANETPAVGASIDSPVSKAGAGASDWTIALASFTAETEGTAAQAALSQARSLPGLENAYLEDRGRTIVMAVGKYDAPGNPAAKKDLERVRQITVGGSKPFQHAILSPPRDESLRGSVPEHELRYAKTLYGKDAMYTLQIGVYCRSDDTEPSAKELAEFRAAAEKAVAQLRREGEEAFYFHGPRRSMVTIGVFNDQEYDASPQRVNPMALPKQSERLLKLRERFPYNLANGAAVKRTAPGQTKSRLDPSFVVTVPN
ncbi:MAG: hypothetical protein JSR77_15370 [Planctomycetes bacterium]|nr:hypothetical protein [Planctomycetota bacterium]